MLIIDSLFENQVLSLWKDQEQFFSLERTENLSLFAKGAGGLKIDFRRSPFSKAD